MSCSPLSDCFPYGLFTRPWINRNSENSRPAAFRKNSRSAPQPAPSMSMFAPLWPAWPKGMCARRRRILDRTMPFPEIIGRLCDQPCRPFCKRGEIGDPLAIGRLEQFCVNNSQTVFKLPKLPAKGGKVVVIGAGLSGMTAALDLARKGRPTTLVTSSSSLGGSLRSYPGNRPAPVSPEPVCCSSGRVWRDAADLGPP